MRKRPFLFMAVTLIVTLVSTSTLPILAGTVSTNNNSTRSNKNTQNKYLKKATPDSLSNLPTEDNNSEDISLFESELEKQITVEVNGKKSDRISFYMKRDSNTNQVTLPDPINVTVKQTTGQAIGEITSQISPVLNQDRERIRIEAIGNTYLSADTPVNFSVSFIDKNIGDETDRPSGSSNDFYIQICSDTQDTILKELSVLYGADGFYTRYSSEYLKNYKGTIINGKYINIAEINLKQQTVPSFTIEHYYKPMTGTEGISIEEVQLNPDGYFTFNDGTLVMPIETSEEGWIQIPVKMKQDSFMALKNEAISNGNKINLYTIFDDLLFIYEDGYMSGGTMNPLPLVYHISYNVSSSGTTGGVSSGGSGGGGGSSGSSGNFGSTGDPGGTGTVVGPTQTVRTTIATLSDIGWITIDGQRYYMNAENQPVTEWLQWTDGKWYYLGSDGIMKTGWTLVDGKWYLLNQDGSMATGMVMVNQQWHLLNQDGSMATGWAQDPAGNWRYFGDNGIMATNYTAPDGRYVDTDGIWRE